MIQFRVDKQSPVPLYRQVVDMVLAGVASGAALPQEQLPTIRDLAVRLEINPNTVVKAYSQLQTMGVLDGQQGTGVFVRPPGRQVRSREDKTRLLDDLCHDFVGRAQLLGLSIDDVIHSLEAIRDQEPEAKED